MIMRTDGTPPRRRYSLGVAGSVMVHAVIVAAAWYAASAVVPRPPADLGPGAGQSSSRDTSAIVRGGRVGADPTATIGASTAPAGRSQPWAVRQAKRLELRLGIAHAIDHLWQSTLFAIGVGLLTNAFRRNRARVRFALWFAASLKFLVPFAVIAWCGTRVDLSALFGSWSPLAASGFLTALPLTG